MKPLVIFLLIFCSASRVEAQTALNRQQLDPTDPCVGATSGESLAACGMDAFRDKKFLVARRAWSRASEQGDYLAAMWLAGTYEAGDGGNPDSVEAYKWYDIAAAIRGVEVNKLPPGGQQREDNKQAINYRDAVAKKMTPDQLVIAQKLAREWLARHLAFR